MKKEKRFRLFLKCVVLSVCAQDIESILLKRTQTKTIDNADQKGGSFSKASFASADTASDINIDDPDFWAKWAKKAEIEEISEEQSLIVTESRSRKQIKRLGDNPLQNISDLDTDSDSDMEDGGGGRKGMGRGGRGGEKEDKKGRKRRRFDDDEDFMEDERDVAYGSWTKSELTKIERATMLFGSVGSLLFNLNLTASLL